MDLTDKQWTVLESSRRLVIRWERHVENFLAMLHLACIRILLRAL